MTILINGVRASAVTGAQIVAAVPGLIGGISDVATKLKAPALVTVARETAASIALVRAQTDDIITVVRGARTAAAGKERINSALQAAYPDLGAQFDHVEAYLTALALAETMASTAATDLHAAPLTVSATNLTIAPFTPSAALIAACDAVLAAIGTLPGR